MKNQWKFYGKTLVACSLLGAFAVSFSSPVEAKRLHDPQMETKVEMHQTLPGGTTVSDLQRRPLKERIQEILNAPPEVEEPVQAAPAARVPVTQSVYDASIVGTPLATPQQCVKYLLRVNPCPDISVSPEELVS